MSDRSRTSLVRAGVLALAGWVLASGAARAQKLDLANPDDALKAMRKVVGSLKDGEAKIFYFYGNVFSRVPGERDRHLFAYQAMNVRQTKTVSEPGKGYGYRMVSREVLFYQDPKTGEILRTWKNPWTGEDNEILHIANDPVNQGPTFAQGPRGPYKFGAVFKDGWGSLGIEVPLFYTNVLGGEYQEYVGGTYQAIEMFGFFFREDELLGPSDTAATNVSWMRASRWLPWMKMGDRVGYLLFSGYGGSVKAWDSLPEALRREIETNYPAYRTPPPLDDNRPNDTSWTVFKKWIDAKRKEAPPAK
jgi:hypothetical protein